MAIAIEIEGLMNGPESADPPNTTSYSMIPADSGNAVLIMQCYKNDVNKKQYLFNYFRKNSDPQIQNDAETLTQTRHSRPYQSNV